MKIVFHKDLGGELAVIDMKIENSKLKAMAELDLSKGVDALGEKIPGESALEMLLKSLIKSAIASL